jgi:DNA-directed RNA polymerase
MTNDLYLTQEALEKESRALTIQRFEAQLTERKQKEEESATYYGAPLMKRAIEPMAEAIAAKIEEAESGRSGPRMTAIPTLKQFDPKVIAFFTAKTIIDKLTSRTNKLQTVAVQIGKNLEDELRYQSFQDQHPWLFQKLMTEIDTTRARKRQNLVSAYNRYCDAWSGWSDQTYLHTGMLLIDLFQQVTGFVEVVDKREEKNKTYKIVVPSAEVINFIEKNFDAAQMLNPVYLPMVVPPADWEGPRGGGYLTIHSKQLTLVKTKNRNYLEELEGMPDQMAPVYEAINHIQRTPWKVNEFVLAAFQIIHDRGLATAGLPSGEDLPVPPSPLAKDQDSKTLTDVQKEQFKAWKKAATAVYDENIRIKSKRLMTSKIRMIAEKFSVYESIYFPHTMDFRGRIYPAPMYLNPQGNSLAKGLLQFADGKPLGTNEAACELAIHGANCYGYDKASMQERVDWVVEHQDQILQAGTDPMADLWWAKEADDPWSFLAFCREWVGYCEHGYDHVSYIPIAKDGSCSGLQHFSAALRDPEGGSAVNLLPTDRPADIYQTVIDKTIAKVQADLTHSGEKDIAQLWLDYGMTRKTAKRTTMTRVYGSTLYSARAFVQEYIMDTDAKRRQEDPDYVSPLNGREFEAAVYLAKHVWASINETVIAAKDGMDWLQECARELAAENLPIVWTTIDGFPVMQNYPDMAKRRVKTKFGDQLVYLTVQEAIRDKLDRRRQGNGISPNWVHANDGCHLRMTVNLAAFNGVTHFAMIHDSFGCHASDVEMLGACLRETFVELYVDNDPLLRFKAEGEALVGKELPALPPKGELDVTAVRDSEFFFA